MSKLKYLSYILLGIGALVFLYTFFISSGLTYKLYVDDPNSTAANAIGGFLWLAYILVGIAALLAIVLPIIGIIQNPKNIKKILTNIGVVVVVLLVSYLVSSSAPAPLSANVTPPSAGTWRLTDTALIATYILAVAAFLTIIVGGVINVIRNR